MKMSVSVILLVTGKILLEPKLILAFGFIKLSLGCRMLLCVTAGLCGGCLCAITNIWTIYLQTPIVTTETVRRTRWCASTRWLHFMSNKPGKRRTRKQRKSCLLRWIEMFQLRFEEQRVFQLLVHYQRAEKKNKVLQNLLCSQIMHKKNCVHSQHTKYLSWHVSSKNTW